MARDVGVVVEPGLKLGQEVFAADHRRFACYRNQKGRARAAVLPRETGAAFRRRELLAPQGQPDAKGL